MMQPSYNEEELLLRLLLGAVFPFAMLVALRLTRMGLRRWEIGWRDPAVRWLASAALRAGVSKSDQYARRAVSVALGVIRACAFSAVLVVISTVWFVLFPQTRPLAVELVKAVVAPFFNFIGKALGGAALVVYSLALIAGSIFLNRLVSRRGASWSPFVSLPLRIAIWLSAAFLFLLPYPGLPRVLAVGLLIIAALVFFLTMRLVFEEVAVGIYLAYSLGLRSGRELRIGGGKYSVIAELRAAQICLLADGERVFLPYSSLLKNGISIRDAVGVSNGE